MYRKIFSLLFVWSLSVASDDFQNRLIHSESPYLQQHAHNPVDWYPWGREAFERAKKEHKLIFLSIGYSTCHWCHVMERESFEDLQIANMMNESYIGIKVDKEEMPQIDTYYQHILTQLSDRRNGWPLSVVLTPEKRVLYISTYIPAEDKYGVEGLRRLLPRLAKLWQTHPEKIERWVEENGRKIASKKRAEEVRTRDDIAKYFVAKMQKRFDPVYKGFDRRPHFPLASHLRLLIDIYRLNGDKNAWEMAKASLDAMKDGGIYDQVEGGFFRYTTDPDWVVPHFEKMLYTNAELIPLYVRLALMTGESGYRDIVAQTIRFFKERFMWEHLFFAASDADSEGREGGYYLYRYKPVLAALQKRGFSEKEAKEVMAYLDITSTGNVGEGYSNIQRHTGFDRPPEGVKRALAILREMRKRRAFAFVDRKIITAWNAMMVRALFEASKIDARYREDAIASLEALLRRLYPRGVLYHKMLPSRSPGQPGLLEDYAFLADALVAGYEATSQKRYLRLAKTLLLTAKRKFYQKGVWYLDDTDFRAPSRYNDKYYTTPLPLLLESFLSVGYLTYDLDLLADARRLIREQAPEILSRIDLSPEATRMLLRVRYGDIVLKASAENLRAHKEKIDKITYPFLLTKAERIPLYLLCDDRTCFYSGRKLEKVVKKIEKHRR